MFQMFETGSSSKDCRKPNNCRGCGGHHHQSICTKDSKRETKPEETSNPKQDSEKTTTSTNCAKTKENVLLQTATATAVNEDGSKVNKRAYFI